MSFECNEIKKTSKLIFESSFSECGLYRWWLKRGISENNKTLIFIGLNPSKASSTIDDPTLRRLLFFGSKWNYGSIIVINIFAIISSSPSIIKKCSDPIGKENDPEIHKRILDWSRNPQCDLWLGWGNKGSWQRRNDQVMSLLREKTLQRAERYPSSLGPLVIGVTKQGHPRHPLYISNEEELREFQFL